MIEVDVRPGLSPFVPWQHYLAEQMAIATHVSVPQLDVEINRSFNPTRRQFLKISAALGAGAAGLIFGARSAEALDGGEEIDMMGNIEEFLGRSPESFAKIFKNSPLYRFSIDLDYPPRNFSTKRGIDGHKEKSLIVLGDANDGNKDTNHIGVNSNPIAVKDVAGTQFLLSGVFLGSKAIPFVTSDPDVYPQAFVNIGAIGVAEADKDLTRVNLGVVLVNMYYTGRPDWMSLVAERTSSEGSPVVFDGKEIGRGEYRVRPLEEVLFELNARRNKVLLTGSVGELEYNDRANAIYRQVEYPLQYDFKRQNKLVRGLYSNGLTKFSLTSAYENGGSAYAFVGANIFDALAPERVFSDNYKKKSIDEIAKEFSVFKTRKQPESVPATPAAITPTPTPPDKFEILNATSVTPEDIIQIPNFGSLNIIDLGGNIFP